MGRGAIDTTGDSLGLVDCCRECGRIKWANGSWDCESCRAEKAITRPPDVVMLTAVADRPPEKK